MNKPKPIIKSRFFQVHYETNTGKIAQIEALHKEYLSCVEICVNDLIKARRVTMVRSEKKGFFLPHEELTCHIKKCAQDHAIGIIKGWAAAKYTSHIKHYIKTLKKDKQITEEEARELFSIGKHSIWEPTKAISQEAIDFYLNILFDPEISGKPPTVNPTTEMRMNMMTCKFQKPKQAFGADYWLNMSTLTSGGTIWIPITGNGYVDDPSEVSKGISIRKTRKGWRIEALERAETELPELNDFLPRIGGDVGLNTILATSDGRLFGAEFKPKFDADYAKIKFIRNERKAQGLKGDSPRVKRLEQKLSGQIKTITGAATNYLVSSFPEGTIFVIEDLDLRYSKGSKRYAYHRISKSLQRKANVLLVNVAYTSQLCPSCGYVHERNREGIKFKCRACGLEAHADVVGAINIVRRSYDKNISCNTQPDQVREYLRKLYWERRNSPNLDCSLEFFKKAPRKERVKKPKVSKPVKVRGGKALEPSSLGCFKGVNGNISLECSKLDALS